MNHLEVWIKAFRLRTLPLSLSSVILGSLLALWQDAFKLPILIGAGLTTLFLQILSNLANDYGDYLNGVDNDDRIGPRRSVQSGEISPNKMKWAVILFAVLSLFSGLWLLKEVSKASGDAVFWIFLLIGIAAIAAAVNYTIGKKPYGYRGLGDLAVFLFFGIAGVGGTYFLHTNEISFQELLPAISIGCLATGVLNLNNMRDIENDRTSGKKSLVVILGAQKSKIYHLILLSLAVISAIAFTVLNFHSYSQLTFLIVLPMLIQNVIVVMRNERPSELDPELKKLAFATLIFAVTFGLGLNY